ncbi:MAG TPA: ATP-binding protein, partial [Puia sp.]
EDTIDEMKGMLKEGQRISHHNVGVSILESDKNLVRNILINLISNAIKFSESQSLIQVNSVVKEKNAVIIVQDKGIGISSEDSEHLFSSFFRGKNAMNIQGTGLGLHIVKRYLDLLGGSIDLQSELGKGTSVIFTIPVKYP